jgi:hypothetical protein
MPKPRYDEEKDETRHAAASEECCEDMADSYGWNLKQVDPLPSEVLSVDCVFDGYCEFPSSRMDLTQGDVLKEDKEDA